MAGTIQQSDRYYLEDSRRIQRETEVIGSRAREIRRLLGVGVDPRDLIDAAVRQAVETKTALDKFREYQRIDPISRAATHQTLSSNLQAAVKDLESVVALYAPEKTGVVAEVTAGGREKRENPFTPGSAAESVEFLEEGLKRGAISDLKRVEREMHSLQRIYQALHGQAIEQQAAIETVAGNMISAESNTAQANKQLLLTQERSDRKLRWKIYFFVFVLVLLVFYALLS